MAYIGRGTESISNVEVLDNLTFNGSASYTLQKSSVNFVPSSANNLLISISGVVQQGNFSVSGSTITFDTTVSGSDTCDWILHYGTGLITTPADGTVSNDKIAYPLAKSGATVSTFNRTTSYGDILEFQKDGTAVGSIGSFSSFSGSLYFSDSSNGILIGGGNVLPSTNTGAIADNTVDLGASNRRFNDLYLGGNIYLGGTTSANALDDYEEGTWTPGLNNYGGTPTSAVATYTKIGRLVMCSAQIILDGTSDASAFSISSLPFTVINQATSNMGGFINYTDSTSVDNLSLLAIANQTNATLYTHNSSVTYNSFGVSNQIRFTLIYITD